jgi:hypothetical protein
MGETMSWAERIKVYEHIEELRGRPLIVYVTSKRDVIGANPAMATDALPQVIRQLDEIPKESKALDLLISSYGGDPMVAWRIMTLIRQRVEKVGVLIPHSAYSAATLVALGADEIIMHPNGHLGPVDMQITTRFGEKGPRQFSTEDISAFLQFVRDDLRITDQEHIRMLFELTCKEISSLGIGFTVRSSKLATDLAERLLGLHMRSDEDRPRIRTIVENMSRKFQSHAYPVSRTEAIDIELPVNKERDEKLEKLMWQAWIDLETELKENIPFDPIMELLNSPEAPTLLAPVPQLDLPMCASATASYQNTVSDIKAVATSSVKPVDFEFTYTIVESTRSSQAQVAKGKLLACRNPDLMINWNMLITSRDWHDLPKPVSEQSSEQLQGAPNTVEKLPN